MNFLWILLAAAATAWGVRATLQRDTARWIKALAVLAYLACGLNTVMLVWWIGDGRLLPQLQISPDVRNWFASHYDGAWPPPHPFYLLFALVAHVVLAVSRRTRRGAVLWPVTAVFLVALAWFYGAKSDRPIQYRRAVGPTHNAYLTVAPHGDNTRLIFAVGEADDGFVRILHVADSESVPVDTRLVWTRDGQAILFQVGRRRTFAVTTNGETIGYLPARSHEWPEQDPALESAPVRHRLSKAAKDVDRFLREHGGVFVR